VGWNRLLLKVVRKKDDGDFSLRIAASADAQYDGVNIRWVTPMPSWSWSMPIVVGERIFVTSEPDELVCINKADGKILWRHTNTTYDATSDEERAKNPNFQEIDPLNAELARGVDADRGTVLRGQMAKLLRKIDKEKYGLSGKENAEAHASAVGYAVQTPASDGRCVYAVFTPGVVVCYDLDGKRQWIANILDLGAAPTKAGKPSRPHPNSASPALIGDRFVVFKGWFRAFDTKTGKVAWDTGNLATDFWDSEGGVPNYSAVHSNIPFRLGGQDFVMGFWGRVLRASDGRVMSSPVSSRLTYSTPVIDGDFAYVWTGQKYKMTLEGDQVKMGGLGQIEGIPDFQMSSPLVHDGLIYILDAFGRLKVTDAQTLKPLYTQRLDMWPLLNFNAIGATPSVALGGKHVFLMDNQGTCVVIEPGRTFKQVGYNRLQASMPHPWPMTTNERTESAPVFDGKCLYIRGEKNLYCIGEK
jgi:outer membrane protein assembly factor BamB